MPVKDEVSPANPDYWCKRRILITTIVSEYTLIHPAEASNNLGRHERFHLSKQPVRRFYFFWWLAW